MANPFQVLSPNANILQEAFPTLDSDLIEDVLASVHDNVEDAFELLLRMTDPDITSSSPPPLPDRPQRTVPQTRNQTLVCGQHKGHSHSQSRPSHSCLHILYLIVIRENSELRQRQYQCKCHYGLPFF